MRIVFHYVLPVHDNRFVVKFLKGHRTIKRKTGEKKIEHPRAIISSKT